MKRRIPGKTVSPFDGQILLLLLTLFLGWQPSYGQVDTATLSGTVSDTTGAVVPEASVTIKNVATTTAEKTQTNASGDYIFPHLRPATYELKVEKAGFKATVIPRITLLVDQKARVDAQLEVGEVTTSVEVQGGAPLVEATSASIGTVVGERQVADLPLNLRRLTSLATLVPGTVSASSFGYAA